MTTHARDHVAHVMAGAVLAAVLALFSTAAAQDRPAAASAGADRSGGAADASKGRSLFTSGTQPSCATCHTLAHAGASGAIGPSLDEMRPAPEQVQRAVKRGIGAMPAFSAQLTDEQIEAVSAYVAQVSGS